MGGKAMDFKDHVYFGEKLQGSYNDLVSLCTALQSAYGSNDKAFKLAISISAQIGRLKSQLDDKVCSEFPMKSDKEVTGVYYCNARLSKGNEKPL
jgi:hypothetical protein